MTTLAEAAEARALQVRAPADRPQQRRALDGVSAAVRMPLVLRAIEHVKHNGADAVRIGGYASTTETPYEMRDMFGPYNEVVTRGAFGDTLAATPLVEYTVNHGAGGALPMAHTRNGTLVLAEDEVGLDYNAYADPRRSDVTDLVFALERGDAAESSFKFRIVSGVWSPDYTEYRINAVSLDRGDVSTVNFGANPTTSSGLRAAPPTVTPDLFDLLGLDGEALRKLEHAMAAELDRRHMSPALTYAALLALDTSIPA